MNILKKSNNFVYNNIQANCNTTNTSKNKNIKESSIATNLSKNKDIYTQNINAIESETYIDKYYNNTLENLDIKKSNNHLNLNLNCSNIVNNLNLNTNKLIKENNKPNKTNVDFFMTSTNIILPEIDCKNSLTFNSKQNAFINYNNNLIKYKNKAKNNKIKFKKSLLNKYKILTKKEEYLNNNLNTTSKINNNSNKSSNLEKDKLIKSKIFLNSEEESLYCNLNFVIENIISTEPYDNVTADPDFFIKNKYKRLDKSKLDNYTQNSKLYTNNKNLLNKIKDNIKIKEENNTFNKKDSFLYTYNQFDILSNTSKSNSKKDMYTQNVKYKSSYKNYNSLLYNAKTKNYRNICNLVKKLRLFEINQRNNFKIKYNSRKSINDNIENSNNVNININNIRNNRNKDVKSNVMTDNETYKLLNLLNKKTNNNYIENNKDILQFVKNNNNNNQKSNINLKHNCKNSLSNKIINNKKFIKNLNISYNNSFLDIVNKRSILNNTNLNKFNLQMDKDNHYISSLIKTNSNAIITDNVKTEYNNNSRFNKVKTSYFYNKTNKVNNYKNKRNKFVNKNVLLIPTNSKIKKHHSSKKNLKNLYKNNKYDILTPNRTEEKEKYFKKYNKEFYNIIKLHIPSFFKC